jgi:hypothetical protein
VRSSRSLNPSTSPMSQILSFDNSADGPEGKTGAERTPRPHGGIYQGEFGVAVRRPSRVPNCERPGAPGGADDEKETSVSATIRELVSPAGKTPRFTSESELPCAEELRQ